MKILGADWLSGYDHFLSLDTLIETRAMLRDFESRATSQVFGICLKKLTN